MRRFLGSLASSLPLSASLFVPAALDDVLGVSGGVVIGTPATLPEFVAATVGNVPATKDGGFVAAGINDDWVATDDVELDRVGDGGRCTAEVTDAGGEGAVKELAEFRCWWFEPLGNGDGGAKFVVGVALGVF
jgi:hypothetical protein